MRAPVKGTLEGAPRARWRPDTLAARLAAALVAFVLLATFAVAGAEYARGRAVLLREARAGVAGRARLAADRLERALRERERIVALWAGLGTSQDLAIDDLDKRLAASLVELAGELGPGARALAVDTAGRVVACSEREWIGRSAAGEPWLSAAPGPALASVPGPPALLAASAPVPAAEGGRPLGRIVLLAPWRSVAAEAAGVDRERTVVRDASGRALVRGALVGDSARSLWGAAETAPVGGVRLTVAVAQGTGEALRPLRLASRQLALLALVVLAVAVPASLVLVRSTTAELRGLTRAAGAVHGDAPPGFAVSPAAAREVRVLAGALETMVARLEASRRELARQESLAAMGTMAAGLAHEIRTPLSILRGAAEMLARRAEAGSREAELASFMTAEVDRLGRLVDDLLVFARPRDPERRPADLAEVAGRAADALEPQAAEAGVAFARALAPAPALADPEQLYQVALNLLANAVQASPPGAEVRVATSADGNGGVLEVADRGTGIGPGALERVWTPFFSTRRGGTGLGLPIVRRIVEAHGGTIALESAPGAGTRATVRIPSAEEAP